MMSGDELARMGLALGYGSVLLALWICRHRVPEWVKPVGIVLVPQLTVWVLFYGLTFVYPPGESIAFYTWLARFGHVLDIVVLWLLIIVIRNAPKHRRSSNGDD